MTSEIRLLVGLAATIGFVHTLLGPDHYLPFIMMSWARKWSALKTGVITFLCGLGHVASSVVLGFIGVALGLALGKLEAFESFRGNKAAWLLIGFGFAYLVWGIFKALRGETHTHTHVHNGKTEHVHEHAHEHEHLHVHSDKSVSSITPWVLFAIFVFGPCEPLIPVLMYPAAESSMFGVIAVAAVFSAATIGTMLAVVLLGRTGVNFLPVKRVAKYSHAIAGGTICLCGLAIQFLGL